ncbi:XdhC family protein [Erwinia sp. Eh17-17]|uniref:XdhC family protein n=1 Tax=Erwinia sp. Eh17-17 TaxID=3080330 RepID=UPI00320AEB59
MTLSSLDITVVESALGWLGKQHHVWLCTVVQTWGSAPRAPGALLAVSEVGDVCGSLSGGCVEQDFLRRLANGDYRQPSQQVRYGAGGLAPDVALPCGGSLEVLIEYLSPSALTEDYLREMLRALRGELTLEKQVTPGQPARLSASETGPSQRQVTQQAGSLRLTLGPAISLLIAGLSPVADYCIHFARMLGFHILVCEHRENYLTEFAARPVLNDGVELVRRFPARYLELHGCQAHTAVLSLTHDARIDDLTLMEACRTPAFYIGALGSRRNSENRRRRLAATGDLTAQQLGRISAPVGLALGSKTPAEIALAIMADIVRVKNGA